MRALATCALVLIATLAVAQPAPVRIGPPTGVVAPFAITGHNFGLSMQVALYRDAFAALDVRTLRFPPGNDADNEPLTRDMIDALLTPWRLLSEPEPWIVANFFEGPDHALAAASYLDEVGMPVRYWEVGNEPDLYPRNRMDPSWTVEVYCERFREFASALRAQDPTNRIAGPAVSGSRPLGEDFLREFLLQCGDVVDILTWHVYPTDGTWEDTAALATSDQVGEEIRRYRSWLSDPERNPRGHQRDIALGITEFGLSWRTASFRHLEDNVAALWLADALGQMATEGIAVGHYFALQAMGGHGLIDRSGWIRPTYFVYELLADFHGTVHAVDVARPGLTAYAARGDAGWQVLVVNRSLDPVEIALEWPAGPAPDPLAVAVLDEEGFDELLAPREHVQSPDQPIAVPARSIVRVAGPPTSLSRFEERP